MTPAFPWSIHGPCRTERLWSVRAGVGRPSPCRLRRWERATLLPAQPRGEPFQFAVAHADRRQMVVGLGDVGGVVARLAAAGADDFEHRVAVEAPRVLRVQPVGDIGQRLHPLAGLQRHRDRPLDIDRGDLLALAQIADGRLAQRRGDREGHAGAGAAAVEAEHEPGFFGRAAIDVGVDAQGPAPAAHGRPRAGRVGESRPPHQRAVAEHPEVAVRRALDRRRRDDAPAAFGLRRRGLSRRRRHGIPSGSAVVSCTSRRARATGGEMRDRLAQALMEIVGLMRRSLLAERSARDAPNEARDTEGRADEAGARYAAACAAWAAGRRAEAIRRLDEALRLEPDSADALGMGGYMLGAMGKPEAALRFYRRALALDPERAVLHANAGKLSLELGRPAEALEAFEAAVGLRPDDADAWNGRAGALRELGRLEKSQDAARRALALKPDFAEAAVNLGNALLKLDRMEEALAAYAGARAARPDYAAALCGEALALRNLGRWGEAMAAFEAAEALGSGEAVAGKGCLLLTLGDFERGFEGYEARWLSGKSIAEALGTRYPTWTGPGKAGERVLVLNDHGLGDTIQFVRYLPMMAAAGVETTFVCPPKLHRLLAPSVRARLAGSEPAETFDAQIAVSSLPRAFRTRLNSVPAEVPYLAAEPALATRWAARIGAAGFRIGIAWQGNPHPEADRARAFPLAAAAPLAALPGVRLISLQKGFGEDQREALPRGMRVETLGDEFDAGPDAFVDTAAAMAHCDLVVTCDTSIAHLAGALARPVWVALKSDAEWRWMTGRDNSPWYPTMRLFRQPRRGAWADVFEAMARALSETLAALGRKPILRAPCSTGDLIDRITILRIKSARMVDEQKRVNVRRELDLLEAEARKGGVVGGAVEALGDELAAVNGRLWEVEDALRVCERQGDFGPRFVGLARSVYALNDQRAAFKRAINRLFDSAVVEEKSYG